MDGDGNKLDSIPNYTMFILTTKHYTNKFKMMNLGEATY